MQTRNRFWVSHVFLVWWYFLFLEIFSGRKRSLCVTYLSIYDKCIFFLSDRSWSPSTEHKVSQVLNWSENLSFRWGKKSCILSDVSSRISCFFLFETQTNMTWHGNRQSNLKTGLFHLVNCYSGGCLVQKVKWKMENCFGPFLLDFQGMAPHMNVPYMNISRLLQLKQLNFWNTGMVIEG